MGDMRDRMLRGELYRADDPELVAGLDRAARLLQRLDAADDEPARRVILAELLGAIGEGTVVRPGFRCDYGSHIAIGAHTFVNYDCVMLDVAPIAIGDHCQIAPKVQLLTASHPIDAQARRAGWESGHPITLADDVWLGGGVIVCPGVTIGAATVVGAGAVVTRDLPAGVVAYGAPATVAREVGEADRLSPPS